MFVRFEENEEEEEGDFLEGEEKTDQSANFPAPWFRHARSSPLAVAATTSGKPSLSKSASTTACIAAEPPAASSPLPAPSKKLPSPFPMRRRSPREVATRMS